MIVPRLYVGTHGVGHRGDARVLLADRGLRDDGAAYAFRGKTERMWPAGLTAECRFGALTFVVMATIAGQITVTPWVDGSPAVGATQQFRLLARTERAGRSFEVPLDMPVYDDTGAEIAREGLRGSSIQIEFALTDLAVPMGRELLLAIDEVDLSFEVLREAEPYSVGGAAR